MDLRDKLSSLNMPPGKVLKIVIGLSVVLLLMWLFTLSHIDYNQGPDTGQYIQTKTSADSVGAFQDSSKVREIRSYNESSGMFTNGLITFLVLLVILIGIWFWLDWKQPGTSKGVQRELRSQMLGEGAQLKIVKVNREIWVLGVTSSSVNLLHRYSKEEWKEEMPEKKSASGDMFRKLFKSQMS